MRHHEIEELTIGEVNETLEAFEEAERRKDERAAVLAWYIIRPHLPKSSNLRPADLLKAAEEGKKGPTELEARDFKRAVLAQHGMG